MPDKLKYEEIGRTIGALVDEKNKAYGDSFKHAGKILEVLYPNGVRPDQYQDMLYTVRVVDKLFRLATDKDAFGENPAQDIAGYSILKSSESSSFPGVTGESRNEQGSTKQ